MLGVALAAPLLIAHSICPGSPVGASARHKPRGVFRPCNGEEQARWTALVGQRSEHQATPAPLLAGIPCRARARRQRQGQQGPRRRRMARGWRRMRTATRQQRRGQLERGRARRGPAARQRAAAKRRAARQPPAGPARAGRSGRRARSRVLGAPRHGLALCTLYCRCTGGFAGMTDLSCMTMTLHRSTGDLGLIAAAARWLAQWGSHDSACSWF